MIAVAQTGASGESLDLELVRLLALPMLRYRLRFQAPSEWPGATGTAWRGGLGHALRRRLCMRRDAQCQNCEPGCAFALFYPAANQRGAQPDEEVQITPFVIDPAMGGGSTPLSLTLLGAGTAHAMSMLAALSDAARAGIGPGRMRLEPHSIAQEVPVGSGNWVAGFGHPAAPVAPAPPFPARIRLRFESPLRVRHGGRSVRPGDFAFADLLISLMRRASALLAQTPGQARAEIDYPAAVRSARLVHWSQSRFGWREYERHSDRQAATMKLGGIVGESELDGAAAASFWPLLWLGQWLHAGKGASFGFGRYRVVADG